MSGKMLVAIDISHLKDQEIVIKTAKKLAGLFGDSITVITVIPDFGMSIVGSYFEKDALEKAKISASDRLHEFVKSTLGKVDNVDFLIRTGTAYEEILDAAEDMKTDLIVMGAHRPELSDYLLGPNAARVVRHSNCSVHVVRD